MSPLTELIVASACFVGTHFMLSHPLRRPLAAVTGERVFQGVYTLVALATFAWMVLAYRSVPPAIPAYVAGEVAWMGASVVMWVASVLLAGSFLGNPALPVPGAINSARRNPLGVFAITRHPMMWSFALWALVHMLIWPTPAGHVMATAILILSLGGAAAQDGKKAMLMGDAWRGWCRRTSFFPYAGMLSGRIDWRAGWPGPVALGGGTLLWLALTWLHAPLGARMAAGIWYWL